jgi:anti-repressor protein
MESVTQAIKVDEDSMTVSARDLHDALEVQTRFNDWFPRMREYGFSEGTDFYSEMSKTSDGGRPSVDYQISIDMAKEICMIQRTEKGKEVRRYFLDLEKAWNTPEQIMSRALRIADRTIAGLRDQVRQISVQNSQLLVDKQVMQPKADYFDELVDRNLLTSFTDCAKELGIKRKTFITFLLDKGYIYRDKKGNLVSKANKKAEGLFEVKQCSNGKTGWAGCQTLITPKGVETFKLLCRGL